MSERCDALAYTMNKVFGLSRDQAESALYVIVYNTRGRTQLFWREKYAGYTNNLLEAGVYTFADAVSRCGVRDRAGTVSDNAVPLSHYIHELRDMKMNVGRLLAAIKGDTK